MPDLDSYIQKGMTELRSKTLKQIQVETAMTWCGRACAAASIRPAEATEYAHEAIEHAALSGFPALLHEIRLKLRQYGIDI